MVRLCGHQGSRYPAQFSFDLLDGSHAQATGPSLEEASFVGPQAYLLLLGGKMWACVFQPHYPHLQWPAWLRAAAVGGAVPTVPREERSCSALKCRHGLGDGSQKPHMWEGAPKRHLPRCRWPTVGEDLINS